jgi:hypothetical protein
MDLNLKIFSLVLVTSVLIVQACKQNDELPARATNLAKPSIQCKVNGASWKSCEPGIVGQMDGIFAEWRGDNVIGNSFVIEGISMCTTQNTVLYMYINNFFGIGNYPLLVTNHGIFQEFNYKPISISFKTNQTYYGEVQITALDTVRSIISGTFYFNAFNADSNRVVKIEDGTFVNINYY